MSDRPHDGGRRKRRKARAAFIRGRILAYLSRSPGHHGAGAIHDGSDELRGIDPAELWPHLRNLCDRGLVFVSYVTIVQPCHGFKFSQTVPAFSHWRHFIGWAPTPPEGGGDG